MERDRNTEDAQMERDRNTEDAQAALLAHAITATLGLTFDLKWIEGGKGESPWDQAVQLLKTELNTARLLGRGDGCR